VSNREQQPAFVPPMLLTSGPVPDGIAWTLEVKWDGCRVQLRHDRRSVSIRTRNGRDCSDNFPELAAISEALGKRRVTLDGSWCACATTGGSTLRGFGAGSQAAPRNRQPVVLQVFDVLRLDGRSTPALPYRDRRELLDELA
jgi:bifunctional non-homologous end joining protein LigD